MPDNERMVSISRLNWTCDCGKPADYSVTYTYTHESLGELGRVKYFCEEHLPDEARAWWDSMSEF